LKNKASTYGKTVLDVCEAYTSKTHPETGGIKQIGGVKRIRLLSGEWFNRDIVGACNILLRALVDKPDCFTVAVGIN
jgi:putative transposase